MQRSTALRAFAIFAIAMVLAAMTGILSQVALAEATFLIAGSLAALMLVTAFITPSPEVMIPVRISRSPRRR